MAEAVGADRPVPRALGGSRLSHGGAVAPRQRRGRGGSAGTAPSPAPAPPGQPGVHFSLKHSEFGCGARQQARVYPIPPLKFKGFLEPGAESAGAALIR